MPAPITGLVVLVLVLGAALLMRAVSDLIVQLLSGSLLALIAWPMLAALRRAKVPSPIALGLTTLVTLSVVIGGCAIIALSLGELVTLIPTYEDRLLGVIGSLETLLAQLGIRTDSDALLNIVSPEQVATVIQAVATSASNAGVALIVIALPAGAGGALHRS
ncbi:MAG TPA: AI-2E family transporter [Candidatus Limnocylindria bacterium]|nr:AI-2E family transporter [Candidatus Limnocylindria bacterium]